MAAGMLGKRGRGLVAEECELCGEDYTDLKAHILDWHIPEVPKCWYCSCGEGFGGFEALAGHVIASGHPAEAATKTSDKHTELLAVVQQMQMASQSSNRASSRTSGLSLHSEISQTSGMSHAMAHKLRFQDPDEPRLAPKLELLEDQMSLQETAEEMEASSLSEAPRLEVRPNLWWPCGKCGNQVRLLTDSCRLVQNYVSFT